MPIPLSYRLTAKTDYTAGNVREKLRTAETAAAINPLFSRNVSLLEQFQPQDVALTDIDISFSSPWIPHNLIEAFISETLAVDTRVSYTKVTSTWSIITRGYAGTLQNTSTYGIAWEGRTWDGDARTYRLTGVDLIEHNMNMKVPQVKRRMAAETSVALDPALTAGAIDKQKRLQEVFVDWLRSALDRRESLERLYNDRFNNLRLPEYDGAHLTFPGMSEQWKGWMRSYQRAAIHQGTLGNAGIYLPVGFGKTLVAVAIAMERRRIDPTIKPVMVVKKATLVQFGRAFREIYPAANILVATVEDCSKGKRELFMARVATGNYDAVIMTHQALESLPLLPETEQAYIEPILAEVESELERQEEVDEAYRRGPRKKKSFIVKNLERLRNRLSLRLEKIRKKKRPGLCFEHTGINLIIADEADVYINCPFITKLQGIAGLSQSTSDIAADFDWKTTWMRQVYGSGRLIMMTGTPIRNTMANLYITQHYLQPDKLDARGLHSFDAWAAMFGQIRTGAEITATGNIKRISRFAEFVNLPELMQMFFSDAIVRRYEDVQGEDFKRPTAKHINVVAPMCEDQLELMQELIRRAEAIRLDLPSITTVHDEDGNPVRKNGKVVQKTDNLLWVSTDGRKAVLDHRLLRPNAPNFHKSKVNQCIRRVFKLWRKTAAARSTQMIFLDLSTGASKAPFSVYRFIRNELLAMGVPHWEIAFIQDCKTDEAKADLFEQVNRGEVRVILGSTQMMGVGVNAQRKLIALHHLDCAWRPCDLEQREGRIIRPGNENNQVLIYRYVTQGRNGKCSFDSFMWQCVESKFRFIRQVMSGDMTVRRLEEDASENPTFQAGQIKALATGDERLMRHVEVEATLENAKRLEKSIDMDLDQLQNGRNNSIPWNRQTITNETRWLERHADDFALVRERMAGCTGEHYKLRLNRKNYTTYKDAGAVLQALATTVKGDRDNYGKYHVVGQFGGFNLTMMSQNDQYVEVFLRSHDDREYKVRFVQDPNKSAQRIEKAYLGLLADEAAAYDTIERCHQRIAAFEQELTQKRLRQVELREVVDRLTLEKAALETALGIDKTKDEMATQVIGDEEDESDS